MFISPKNIDQNINSPLFKGIKRPISRYGFNGKEKDDENSVGKYDFGARIYDSRIGRWLAIDNDFSVYPNVAPYTFAANTPIIILDSDGNLLRDSKGRLIVVDAGLPSVAKAVALTNRTPAGGGYTKAIIAKVHFKEVYVFANDGTKIKAFIHDKSKPIEYFQELYDANGKVVAQKPVSEKFKKDLEAKGLFGGESSNCHGVSLANGELQIFNSKELTNTIEKETEFESLKTTDGATIVVFKQNENVVHSAKVESDGAFTYTDGGTPTKQGDLNEASIKDKYGSDYKYKKEVQKKDNWAGGEIQGTLRIYKNMEDLKKKNPTDYPKYFEKKTNSSGSNSNAKTTST